MANMMYARDYYGKALVELGEEIKDVVVLDADLSGSTRTSMFAKTYPERFFNVGVAEQNLITIAAGLAAAGKIVFASTFAIFATGRPWDQIRNTICMNNLNVKIVASHAGITVGPDGASHQACEDIAIMRVIPNMKVVVPCDPSETYEVVKTAAILPGPFYIRFGRSKVPFVDKSKRRPFELGRGDIIIAGDSTVVIIACGIMVNAAIEAANALNQQGIRVTVVNMSSIKPIDTELLWHLSQNHSIFITAEEHNVVGGLGSAVIEELARFGRPFRWEPIGIYDTFGQSGEAEELLHFYGLTSQGIVDKVLFIMKS